MTADFVEAMVTTRSAATKQSSGKQGIDIHPPKTNSLNLITQKTMRLLFDLACQAGLTERIVAMFSGEKINLTERLRGAARGAAQPGKHPHLCGRRR